MTNFGILNVNKPAGRTSREVVDHVERLTRPARAGHAGTLDPLATGVLVVCVGRATRLIEYIQRMPKQYRATFLLGRRSDTDDIEGHVVEIAEAPRPDRQAVEQALRRFVGVIQQRPPAHSAVKIAGRRAYELARRGKTPELAPRPVTIHGLTVRRYEYPELGLDIECGSGTYVRALGRDLAEALGTGAVLSALERTAVGRFRSEEAVAIDDLTSLTLPRHLQPAITAVAELPRLELTGVQINEIRNGRPIARPFAETCATGNPIAGFESAPPSELAATDYSGQLVAMLREKHVGQLWPVKNFV